MFWASVLDCVLVLWTLGGRFLCVCFLIFTVWKPGKCFWTMKRDTLCPLIKVLKINCLNLIWKLIISSCASTSVSDNFHIVFSASINLPGKSINKTEKLYWFASSNWKFDNFCHCQSRHFHFEYIFLSFASLMVFVCFEKGFRF